MPAAEGSGVKRSLATPESVTVEFAGSPLPMYMFDAATRRFMAVNDAALAYFGYDRRLFLTLKLEDIRPREERARLLKGLPKLRRGERPAGVWRHLKSGGEVADVEVTVQPVASADGRPAFLTIVKDVTAERRLERELAATKRLLTSVLEGVPDYISSFDRAGRILFINKNVPGYGVADAVGRKVYEFLRRSSPALWRRMIAQVFRTGRAVTFETEGVGLDGSPTRYQNRLAPVRDAGRLVSAVCVTTDITATNLQTVNLRESERALRLSDQRLSAILDGAADIVFTLDPKGRLTFVNRPEGRAGVGKPLFPVLDPAARKPWRRALAQVLRAGKVAPFETYYTEPKTGLGVWYLNRLSPLRDGGKIVGAVAIASDLTARKKLESDLIASESYWRDLLAQSPDFVIVLDRAQRIQYINRLAKGFVLEQVIGTSGNAYLAPESQIEARRANERVLRTGKPETIEVHGLGDRGKLFWYSSRVAPLRRGGRIDGLVVVSRDITEEKTLRSRFESVFKSSRDAIDYLALDGTLLEVNPAYEKLTGYARAEVVNRKRMFEMSPPEYHHLDKAAIAKIIRTGEPVEFEKEYLRKDGTRVPVNLTTFVVRGPTGKTEGFAAIIKDITERRRLEREILEAGAREQAKLGRDLHDSLGQTITGMSLLAKGLRSRLARRGAPEAKEALRLAELSSHAVSQVRGMARGLLPAELQTAGLGEALQELAANAKELFGIRCALTCPKDLRIPDEAMAVQLYRIAQEAVHNAAKHARSPTGVRVRLSLSGRRLTLSILDDGVGIPSPARRGRGLGLGIMAHRAQMIDAELTLRRRPGGGTEVVCACSLPPLQRKP